VILFSNTLKFGRNVVLVVLLHDTYVFFIVKCSQSFGQKIASDKSAFLYASAIITITK